MGWVRDKIGQSGRGIQAPTEGEKRARASQGKEKKRTSPYGREEKERREAEASGWLGIKHANGPHGLACGRIRRTGIV